MVSVFMNLLNAFSQHWKTLQPPTSRVLRYK